MAATFHTYGRLLHHTQYARSWWCIVRCTPLHCNNLEFTIYLMIVGLLSTSLLHYLKCQDQRISKNCRSTVIFCSSWNIWGGPFFTFSLPGGAVRTPAPRQLRHWVSRSSAANSLSPFSAKPPVKIRQIPINFSPIYFTLIFSSRLRG